MKHTRLAGCVIYNEAGELLLLHRKHAHLTQWEIPGGKIESGEDAKVAATREAIEELGVSVDIIRSLGRKEFEQLGTHWHYEWFEAKIKEGEVPQIMEKDKFDALRYFTLETIRQRDDVSPNVINLVGILET